MIGGLHLRLLWELARYDVLYRLRGMQGVRQPCERRRRWSEPCPPEIAEIREAFTAVAPFYWKRVHCLQRSIVTARVMRRRGVPAEVVIGYRPAPFFSHAWVEVSGRVVNDSPTFQRRLQVLERLWTDQ